VEPGESPGKRWKGCKDANPGLDPELPVSAARTAPRGKALVPDRYRGRVKSAINGRTGYGFVECEEIQQQYGRDAFLHARGEGIGVFAYSINLVLCKRQ